MGSDIWSYTLQCIVKLRAKVKKVQKMHFSLLFTTNKYDLAEFHRVLFSCGFLQCPKGSIDRL
jgi:hypothetical protein